MIGGFDGSQYYKSVKRFNAVKQTWQEVSPMYHQVNVKTGLFIKNWRSIDSGEHFGEGHCEPTGLCL